VSCLTCGYNGSGNSAMISVAKVVNANKTILSRCLINIGITFEMI